MITNDLLKQIQFIKEIDKIKYIQRRTCLLNSDRPENDAEHSWHLALMAIALSEHANKPVDILKVIKMVLIHDIVEIDSGDVFVYDKSKSHKNTEEEFAAAKRIFGLLPENQGNELIALWKEFEDGETDDPKFGKSLDKLEPLLQNFSNNGGTWDKYNVTYNEVYTQKKSINKGSNTLWEYAENLLNESVDKGILKK